MHVAPVENLDECKNLVHACASAKVSAKLSQVENLRRYVANPSCAHYTTAKQYLSSAFSDQASTRPKIHTWPKSQKVL
jgi:hypothetical protein